MHGYKWPINCTRTRTATFRAIATRGAWPGENRDRRLIAVQARLDTATAELERLQLALAAAATKKDLPTTHSGGGTGACPYNP